VRMKRRQREDLRLLWHFPTGIGVARAGKILLTFGTSKRTRIHLKARSVSNCMA
jgi:hypothetical protein